MSITNVNKIKTSKKNSINNSNTLYIMNDNNNKKNSNNNNLIIKNPTPKKILRSVILIQKTFRGYLTRKLL
jgi:hypothetical protein